MGDQIVHCPRCGHLVHADDWFCDTCGLPLKRERLEHLDQYIGPELVADEDVQFTPRKRPSIKSSKTLKFLTLSALAVVVIGGYGGGKYYFSKSATLERIIADPAQQGNSVTRDGRTLSSQQRAMLKTKIKNRYNLSELHHHGRIGDAITYRKTGQRWLGFDRYQLVVDPVKIDNQKHLNRFNGPKTSSLTKVDSHSLNEHQKIDQLFQQFWLGMNHLTANGQVRQNLASFFIGGKNNDTYQHLNQMAITYYHAGYDVRYEPKIRAIKGHRQPTVQFDLSYSFYSEHHVHVQKFHWHAELVKNHRQYMIQAAIGDLKPFQDQVLKNNV